MTELLSAEDIKKAVGAFTGEQRAPLPALPLLPSPWPLRPRGPPCPPRPISPPLRSSPLPMHPAGCWLGGNGGSQRFPYSDPAGLGAERAREGQAPCLTIETCGCQRLRCAARTQGVP